MVKILIDDCFPVSFKETLKKHFDLITPVDLQASADKDGVLLKKAHEYGINFFLTIDKNLPFMQALQHFNITIAVLYPENISPPSLIKMENKIIDRIKKSNGEKFFVIV